MEEQYEMEGNQSVGFKGFILTRLAEEVKESLDESEVEDVEVEKKGMVVMKYDHAVISRSQTTGRSPKRLCMLTDVKFTQYFLHTHACSERSDIRLEWIQRVIDNPVDEFVTQRVF